MSTFYTVLTFNFNYQILYACKLASLSWKKNQLKCEKVRFLSETCEILSKWVILNFLDWTLFKSTRIITRQVSSILIFHDGNGSPSWLLRWSVSDLKPLMLSLNNKKIMACLYHIRCPSRGNIFPIIGLSEYCMILWYCYRNQASSLDQYTVEERPFKDLENGPISLMRNVNL